MKKLILSIISFFVIASVPIDAYAVRVLINTSGCSTDGSSDEGIRTSISPVLIADSSIGCFSITNQSTTSNARVFLNDQPTFKTLVLTNAVIRNTSTSTSNAIISIVFEHEFPAVPRGAQQYYSLGMSGFFKRGTGTALATGSSVFLDGFGFFDECNAGCLISSQIVEGTQTSLSHTVGSTNSFVDPNPSLKDNFSCNDLVTGDCTAALVPTVLQIRVFISMRGGDSLTVSSSFDSFEVPVTEDQSESAAEALRNLLQALASLPTDVQVDSINMISQQGVIPVAILGSVDYDPTHPTTGIDPDTVDFMGASPFQGSNIADVSGPNGVPDLIPDLLLRFFAQETHLVCGDSLGTWTGQTFDGKPAGGSDSIRVINPKDKACK